MAVVFRAAALAIAAALVAAGCGRSAPGTGAPGTTNPSAFATTAEATLDGLLVAAGAPLVVTDADGSPVAFDPPSVPVVAVTTAGRRIVTIDESGDAAMLDLAASGRGWSALVLPVDQASGIRLVAIDPLGRRLAIAVGNPAGTSFDLVVASLDGGTTRRFPIARGLNGPPAWIGPGSVAVDVIRDDGTSGIATIDVGTGAVTDRPGTATVVAASADGSTVAIDDPASGDVLVGAIVDWEPAALAAMTRIHGPPATGVERLAIGADGQRIAIVRRTDTATRIAILIRGASDWRTVRTLTIPGDGPVVVAWLD